MAARLNVSDLAKMNILPNADSEARTLGSKTLSKRCMSQAEPLYKCPFSFLCLPLSLPASLPLSLSPSPQAVTRATAVVAVTFNVLDEVGALAGQHACLQLGLSATVGQLKERVGALVGLPTDEFRMYRKTGRK